MEGLVYQHYKGGLYKVLHLAYSTDTGAKLVVYIALTDGKIWVRDYDEFTGVVEGIGTRFRVIK